MSVSVDKVTFEVAHAGLRSIPPEIRSAMMRTAYSPLVAVGGDLSTGLADPRGRLVAQGKDIPAQLGALPFSFAAMLADYAGTLAPGDVVIGNDPFLSGSNHLNDVRLIMPAFDDQGGLLGYVCNCAHWIDIGGASAGGYNPRVPDVYAEGIRIPPMLAYRNYEPVTEFHRFLFTNVRGAKERMWDLRAGLAGCLAGERELKRLARKFGSEVLIEVMDQAIGYSEKRMRARIAALPDGDYHAVDWVEGDGWEDVPIRIEVTVRIRGSNLEVDWAGTQKAVRGGVNLTMPSTAGCSVYAAKAVLDPEIPSNAGLWAPVAVTAPEGCLVNCSPPSASSAGVSETQQRLADLLMAALSQAAPTQVIAGSFASAMVANIHGPDPVEWRRRALGRPNSIVIDQAPGGMGARATKDGVSGIKVHTGNTAITPVEMIEFTAPARILRWERVPDTGGAGRQRGGCSVVREYEMLEDVQMTILAERARVPPFGLFGGWAASAGEFEVVDTQGSTRLSSKNAPLRLLKGTRFRFQPAGGGGYGSPTERPPERVLDDVLDGYVSVEGAARDYGVVVVDGRLDEEATARLRAERDLSAPSPLDPGEWEYGEITSTRPVRTP